MHPKIAFLISTAAYLIIAVASQAYTPDPYSSQSSRNYSQDFYNDPQRYNSSQDRYNQDRYGNPDQRYGSDRYNQDRYNQDRYNQDRNNPDRYNQDRNNPDRYNQDRYNQDRNNPDRYNQDRNNPDRYNQDRNNPDRYNQDRYNQDRYNQDRYNTGGTQPYRPYDTRGGSGGFNVDDGTCCEDYCYRRSEPYLQYATKTAYQFAVKHNRGDQFKIPQCQPVLFWSLNKYGARLPDAMLIPRLRNLENTRMQIISNYDQRQTYPRNGRLCEDDLDLFRRWRWNDSITEQRAHSLTSQGAEDLRILARKYQTNLRPFLDMPYNEQQYKFEYTESDRAHDSYLAYVEGLFPNAAYRVHADVVPGGVFQGSYSSCPGRYGSGGGYSSSGGYSGGGAGYVGGQNYGSSGQNYGSSGQNYGSGGQNYGSSGQNYGSSGQNYGSSGQNYGSSGQNYGSSGQNYGSSGQNYGSSGQNYGSSGQNYGSGGQNYGSSGQSYGSGSGYSSGSYGGGYSSGGYSGSYGGGFEDDPFSLQEYNKFRQRPEFRDLVKDVGRRLGFKYTLNDTVIDTMYDMCRYEKAWYPRDQIAWCAAFTEKHLKILEYAEDLKYYYKYGYGNEQNVRKGCHLLKDVYNRFENAVNGGPVEKVSVRFRDTASLQLLLVALGAARDMNRLTAENYFSQQRRHWRTSTLTPFAGNLVAILHQCQPGEFKVMFYLNESPLDIPGCQVGLCSWSVFRDKAEEAIRHCGSDYCGDGAANLKTNNIMFGLSLITLLVFYKLFY